jgi:mannitol/fructose-specific phosphotransferase system IIA component (Ntr-type)
VPSLAKLLGPGRILDLDGAPDREAVLRALVGPVAEAAGLPSAELLAAVLEREAVVSTGFGGGVAMPHIRHPGVADFHTVLGRAREGVEYDAIDGEPVRLLLLIVGPESEKGRYQKLMRRAATFLKDERDRLLDVPDLAAAVAAVLTDY